MTNNAAVKFIARKQTPPVRNGGARPILFLTINNGAAHTTAAETLAAAWRKINFEIPTRIVEVSQYMSPLARLTHVSLYLWLVKNAPKVWEKIDAYQKRQTQTSPEWFYRRECRKLFDLVGKIKPSAIVATEVGCGEIAALIKRDLDLKIPLVAVSLDADADRAWIQPETDFYSVTSDAVKADFENLGAKPSKIHSLGVPLREEFLVKHNRENMRRKVCAKLNLPENLPLVLIGGGGEGLGKIRQIADGMLASELPKSILILAGKNEKLQRDGARLARENENLRVLGWTEYLPEIYCAADILISKLGLTLHEAAACGLPIIALEPPPGAERIQFEHLEKSGVGRAVNSVREAVETAADLLKNPEKLFELKQKPKSFEQIDAAGKVAEWLAQNIEKVR